MRNKKKIPVYVNGKIKADFDGIKSVSKMKFPIRKNKAELQISDLYNFFSCGTHNTI